MNSAQLAKATRATLGLFLLGAAACGEGKEPATPVGVSTASGGATTKTSGPNLANPHSPIYDLEEKDIDGGTVRLDRYAGKVMLVVNVASKCGFTPQYEGLEALYDRHQSEGLVVLGFPSDQFGNQEPGSEGEIKTFCTTRYAVKFPLFAKIDVNGSNANPLYRMLRSEAPGTFSKELPGADKLYAHLEKTMPEVLNTDAIKWNFTKFLIDRQGKVVKRFEPVETPQAMEPEIVALLAKK